MYTLTKGPSKFVASARRGPPRQLGFEGYSRDKLQRSQSNGEELDDLSPEMSNPRPTFQHRRPIPNRRPPQPINHESNFSENHIEMAQLLLKQWQKAYDSLNSGRDGDSYEIYREKEPNKDLDDFQPFLEKIGHGTGGRQYRKNSLGKSPS